MSFKFQIGANVQIDASGEAGEIIGRAEYSTGENTYLMRYKSADGRAVESWWGESAISLFA
ncbi:MULTISPECIES: hypothetical protein [unclassified Paraburkholderia]|uniref:hypothetical protein n=1 Tax=unclassified Paraburkholderia TaxID=2615204 RepID=UPI001618A247|nr:MULTISPECIES: hypothetical protein [unclassified Paraburkholderia]MBB5444617.1 hypothetical protein [Paraburkholderia sp. WSM4177]MBB5485441.1 hypothetical protein [Paraburkholderia sp. WSM4180]